MSSKIAKVRKPESAQEGRSPLSLPIRHRKCFGRFAAPLQEELNCLFDEVFADTETLGDGADISFPAVDISESEKTYNIEVNITDMAPEDLDISTTYNFLTITGEQGESNAGYRSFHRTFSLPETADTSKAKASFKDGVLIVAVPKKTGRIS